MDRTETLCLIETEYLSAIETLVLVLVETGLTVGLMTFEDGLMVKSL